ncbi:hypothetical protein SAMN05443432_11038 [Roseovarius litoreus]|uniref:Uncharacterized protein n=1 Tax=Roseovarius litoreus TaxID=1155722 RepID=A0A1M7K9T5_9RHOB|nr:hypothetical protein SAMN05443432_11038 [Roseovarius litoreus]
MGQRMLTAGTASTGPLQSPTSAKQRIEFSQCALQFLVTLHILQREPCFTLREPQAIVGLKEG